MTCLTSKYTKSFILESVLQKCFDALLKKRLIEILQGKITCLDIVVRADNGAFVNSRDEPST